MGMNMILSIIMGIAMTAIIGSQVAPSMMEKVKATKVEAKAINNQEVIFEAVKRYITMKQTNPTTLQDIINEQFLKPSINDNGFGGTYEIEIDGSKGLLKVKTTIEDPKAQEIFLNSFKNKFIPTRVVGKTNEFETTFVIPTDIMHGRGLFMTGIPVQATPPTDTSLKYWYDTSGKEVALRMYDPTSDTWKKVAGTSGSGSISEGALVDASGNNFTKDTLPTTDAEVGDIKYAYDSMTNTIQEYVYTGTTQGWKIKGGDGLKPTIYPKSCLEYKIYGNKIFPYRDGTSNDFYTIDPDGVGSIKPFEVYCDMHNEGGGWTIPLTNRENPKYEIEDPEVIHYLMDTIYQQYHQIVKQGQNYSKMGYFQVNGNTVKIDFIPNDEIPKDYPLEINLNGNYIFIKNDIRNSSRGYILSDPNLIPEDGSIAWAPTHPKLTQYLVKTKFFVPIATRQQIHIGGGGYRGTSDYLNLPSGLKATRGGALGYREKK